MKPKKSLRDNLIEARLEKDILQENIADFLNKRQSHVSYVEKAVNNNTFVHYLFFLRSKGVDLNKVFDNSSVTARK